MRQRTKTLIRPIVVAALVFSEIGSADQACGQFKYQGIMRLISDIGLSQRSPSYNRCEKLIHDQQIVNSLDKTYLANKSADNTYRANLDEQYSYWGIGSKNDPLSIKTTRNGTTTIGQRTNEGSSPQPEITIDTLPSYQTLRK